MQLGTRHCKEDTATDPGFKRLWAAKGANPWKSVIAEEDESQSLIRVGVHKIVRARRGSKGRL